MPMNLNTTNAELDAAASRPKRAMTARMHATRVARAKSAQSLRRTHRVAARPHECRASASGNPTTARHSEFIIKLGLGEFPPYNDHNGLIQDPYSRKMYMVGGINPGDEGNCDPTSDFYSCDMSNMRWTNLTHRLRQCNPYNRAFSNERPQLKTLPHLSYPGCTLLRLEGTSYIALFGGYDYAAGKAMSNILIIDPDEHMWWPLKFEGDDSESEVDEVSPRINPTVVAINETIYVFGGYRKFDEDGELDGLYHSFSIAEHVGEGVYRWSTRDIPYSPSVPVGHVFHKACPVYNGIKILLTPGRFASDEPITFTQENCFFYHITNKRFQPATADVTGIFPPGIRWYSVFSPTATPPLGSPQKTVTLSSTPLTPYSVILCAYVDVPDTDDVAPEIWHLQLSPEERIECLNIKQKIWDLNSEFQGCAYIDGQVRILGTDHPNEKDRSNAKCNTYLDIPLKR